MDYLNLLVCIPVIFWIAIGIRAHSNWIQSVFVAESKKIKQQSQMIREFGYGSLNTRDKLVAKKGLVFAYWEGSHQDQKPMAQLESLQSPVIFQLVNFSLDFQEPPPGWPLCLVTSRATCIAPKSIGTAASRNTPSGPIFGPEKDPDFQNFPLRGQKVHRFAVKA